MLKLTQFFTLVVANRIYDEGLQVLKKKGKEKKFKGKVREVLIVVLSYVDAN